MIILYILILVGTVACVASAVTISGRFEENQRKWKESITEKYGKEFA